MKPTTRHVVIGNAQITLYSLNGKEWFSSPISLIAARNRRRAELEALKAEWQAITKMDRFEIVPVPVVG